MKGKKKKKKKNDRNIRIIEKSWNNMVQKEENTQFITCAIAQVSVVGTDKGGTLR